MPSIIAILTRHGMRWAILAANLVLWGLGYVSARQFLDPGGGGFQLSVPIAIVGWLALLAYGVRGKASDSQNRPPP